jgi:CIC family chloride channel protein
VNRITGAWRDFWSLLQRRWTAARAELKAAVLKYLPSEPQYLFGLTLVIGAVCGLMAVAFHLSIRLAERILIERALHLPGWIGGAATVLVPTAGGLAAGAILHFVVPGARGSGIPQVKEAFALKQGLLSARDAIGKFLLSVLQIGTGASLGREGPTVHICAATASVLSRATPLPASSTRRLMPVGVAAGIAAAFNAPIAAVTFTIEEIVGTLDQTVLSGVVVAAAVAAIIERSVLGTHPIIEVEQSYGLKHASSLPLYMLLGVAAAFVSVLFTDLLLKLRLEFRKFTRVPRWAHPSIGGFVTGALALFVIRVAHSGGITGGGYATLGEALHGRLAVQVLAGLCLLKLLATVSSYSSGGSGGIFAPSLFIGAMLGGLVGALDVAVLGHENEALGAFALVGMGAAFAGIIRAPITSVLIIVEMTGSYGLVLPLMISNMLAYGLARHYRPLPIYEALLAQDGVNLPERHGRALALETMPVEKAMTADVVTLSADSTVGEAADSTRGRVFSVCPVLDEQGRFMGLVPLASLRLVAEGAPNKKVSELAQPGETVSVDTALTVAAGRMNAAKVRQLAVLDVTGRLAGILAISDVVSAHARATTAAPPTRTDGLLATKVSLLAVDAQPVPRSIGLRELLDRLLAAKSGALPVEVVDGVYGVVLLEQVKALWLEGAQLNALVVAADVVRRAPAVTPDSDVLHALKLMDLENLDALPLVDGPPGTQPRGVVTRTDVGRFLFAQYARRGQPSPRV